MENYAKQFIGKECLIYIMSGSSNVEGVIKDIHDNGILVEDKNSQLQLLNLDYVTRIREYPKNKKGKKKIVLD